MELDNLDFIMLHQTTVKAKGNRRLRKNKSKCRVSLTVCTATNDCQCRPCKRRKFASRRHEPTIPLTSSSAHVSIPFSKRPSLRLQDVSLSELMNIQLSPSHIDTTATATTKGYECSTDPRKGEGFHFTFQSFDESKYLNYEAWSTWHIPVLLRVVGQRSVFELYMYAGIDSCSAHNTSSTTIMEDKTYNLCTGVAHTCTNSDAYVKHTVLCGFKACSEMGTSVVRSE